jgi:predicted nucleotidyltransferase
MTAKVMVSFPEEFLSEVDRVAQEEHRSRSELVREALRLYIGTRGDADRPSHKSAGARYEEDRRPRAANSSKPSSLSAVDREIARELGRRLSDVAPIRNLRVFGSRARGDSQPGSDLDLFIELDEVTPQLQERVSVIAWQVGLEMDRVISTVVVSHADLEEGPMGANPLILEVEREGVRP